MPQDYITHEENCCWMCCHLRRTTGAGGLFKCDVDDSDIEPNGFCESHFSDGWTDWLKTETEI